MRLISEEVNRTPHQNFSLDFSFYVLSCSGGAAEAKAFCLRLIDTTASFAACFKPNAAFFEAFGPEGITAMNEVTPNFHEDIRGELCD